MGRDAVDHPELGAFLRSRRARVTPAEAGLPYADTRRVPGLRRSEVAELAGVSPAVYARLERGHAGHVSAPVLDAIARALRLSESDRAHLYAVAYPDVAHRRPMRPQQVRPALRRVLDSLPEVPVLVLGRRLDVLAANPLARAFFTDFAALPGPDRNLARFLFLDPAARILYRDWPAAAGSAIAALRRYAAHHRHDPDLIDLVGELSAADADFRRWWGDPDIADRGHSRTGYRHPVVGDLTLQDEELCPIAEPDQTLILHLPEPGSSAEHALNLLSALVADVLTAPGRPAVRKA